MTEVFNVYMKDIRKTESIKKQDQFRLIKLAQEGDEIAKELLIESNLLLVVSIAKQYMNLGVELDEMICEGNIGLITAIDKWKDKSNTSFTSVASFWIKAAITRNCLFKKNIVRLPENQLYPMLHGTWSGTYYSQCSLDSKDEDGNDLHNIITDDYNHNSLVAKEELSEFDKIVKNSLNKLNELELSIIELKFGFNTPEVFNFNDISIKLNITSTEARNIYNTAIKKMRS